MSELNLDLSPAPPATKATVIAARHRRALVADLVGEPRNAASGKPEPTDAAARTRAGGDAAWPGTAVGASVRRDAVAPGHGRGPEHGHGHGRRPEPASGAPESAPAPWPVAPRAMALQLDDALVVPAGALLRGYLRARALLLIGDIVGNVHCTAGPVVIRAGATLKGRLVATGDVYVCGSVADSGGGAVISTRGKLTLASGARVDGDVRSGWLDIHDGAVLHGVARACED